MATANDVKNSLSEYVELGRKAKNEWFFKTGPGQYSEGDQFIGVRVPEQRIVAKAYKDMPLVEVKSLFGSPVHEHRLTAAMLLTYAYTKKSEDEVYDLYIETVLHNTTNQVAPDFKAYGPRRGVDNWDIVDSSAHKIIGRYLADRTDRSVLYELADHSGLWQNRVAMISTAWFIGKRGEFDDALNLAESFLTHKHDLMHKATGWMLREIGKQDAVVLTAFLNTHVQNMPRTMLRYAIEHLPEHTRKDYLSR